MPAAIGLTKVNSILMGWYPGMHGGLALAEILTGIVNPSGRLPLSFPRRTEDLPSFHPQALCVEYDLYHDYRYFDRENSKPAFPFGHGLGYTTFLYSGIRFETISDQKNEPKVRITAIIKNTGKRDGVEIVQLYLSRPKTAEADHPQRELKAFHRCEIKAGESIEVQFEVDSAMMAWFNPMKHHWQRDAGVYTLSIGPNAMEQPLVIRYELPNFLNSDLPFIDQIA